MKFVRSEDNETISYGCVTTTVGFTSIIIYFAFILNLQFCCKRLKFLIHFHNRNFITR